jgi:prepilin-type N-terminal cleavage/methylation domain-containing protein
VKKSAFTLFEMIIVVALIGIIYTVVLQNFNTKKNVQILKIQNLKESLLPLYKKGNRIDLYIYDRCKKATLFINNEVRESYKPKINIREFEDLKTYKLDNMGELQELEFTPILLEEKLQEVCFKFSIFKNGSSSSYIVKKDKKYYIFYPYFQDVNTSLDEDEAIDLLTHKEYRGVSIDEVND